MPFIIDWNDLLGVVLTRSLRLILILILVLAGIQLARRLVPRVLGLGLKMRLNATETELSAAEFAKRQETLKNVFLRTTEVTLIVVGGLMALAELGISIAPILAGAGIAGVALGFGAQSLVKDLLAGVFILLENQYGQGDVVQIAGVDGVVEEVNLRRTVLRNLDGVVHTVPNGEIRVASNLTRGWSRVNLNVNVGFDTDLDEARALLDRVGEELAADPEWGPLILEAPKVLRVDGFLDHGVALKILATTKPIKQWDVAGELRRRIKQEFDRAGIAIPYPHQVVLTTPGSKRHDGPDAPGTDGEQEGGGDKAADQPAGAENVR